MCTGLGIEGVVEIGHCAEDEVNEKKDGFGLFITNNTCLNSYLVLVRHKYNFRSTAQPHYFTQDCAFFIVVPLIPR